MLDDLSHWFSIPQRPLHRLDAACGCALVLSSSRLAMVTVPPVGPQIRLVFSLVDGMQDARVVIRGTPAQMLHHDLRIRFPDKF